MLDLKRFASYKVVPSAAWIRGTKVVFDLNARLVRARVLVEGMENLPSTPSLIATNSTQKYDFLPIRWALHRRGVGMVTITKAKSYNSPTFAYFLGKTGVVPLASRGYFIIFDFLRMHRRRPTDDEYRALRTHLDQGTKLPDAALFRAIETTARDVLGERIDPARGTYRETMQRLYRRMMGESVRLCREALAAGYHVQVYPEGTVSSRLGPGRIGAVQLAIALGVPIVPAGMNGCREGMRDTFMGGGTIRVRLGAAWRVAARLPADFRPFDPDHERTHRAVLQRETDGLMDRIDALLDPKYRAAVDFQGDGSKGTRRFL